MSDLDDLSEEFGASSYLPDRTRKPRADAKAIHGRTCDRLVSARIKRSLNTSMIGNRADAVLRRIGRDTESD